MTAEALLTEHGFDHHPTYAAVLRNAAGCDFCRLLRDKGYEFYPRPENHTAARLIIREFKPQKTGERRSFRLGCIRRFDTWEYGEQWLDVEVFTSRESCSSRFGFPLVNCNLESTASWDTFEFIRRCLQRCLATHRLCSLSVDSFSSWSVKRPNRHLFPFKKAAGNQAARLRNSFMPKRLLDLTSFSDNESADLRLVETVVPNAPYATLSHCWGSSLTAERTTTIANLDERKVRIHFTSLTPNFRDAVIISRRLGIRYLWIDAMCILQDSQHDWVVESAKMAEVYGCSLLTIAADASDDSFGGCFNARSVTQAHLVTGIAKDARDGSLAVEVKSQMANGHVSSVVFLEPTLRDTLKGLTPAPCRNSPLMERGWVFQEKLLSPRIIHFTSSQVVWECWVGSQTEDLFTTAFGWEQRTLTQMMRSESLGIRQFLNIWYRDFIYEDYARRKFTKRADRLVAIAGVAKSIQQHRRSGRYLAGIWESNLHYGLSWSVDMQEEVHMPSRAPSWTWASHDTPLSADCWKFLFTKDPSFSFVEAELKCIPGITQEFGHVNGGSITVKGKLGEMKLHCEWGPRFTLYDVRLDDKARVGDRDGILACHGLLLGSREFTRYFLLLEQCDDRVLFKLPRGVDGNQKVKSFKRIGICTWNFRPYYRAYGSDGWKNWKWMFRKETLKLC